MINEKIEKLNEYLSNIDVRYVSLWEAERIKRLVAELYAMTIEQKEEIFE